MLILERKVTESLIVGDDIKFTILGVNGKHVRIGVEAPRHISIHREEVYDRIQKGIPHKKFQGNS